MTAQPADWTITGLMKDREVRVVELVLSDERAEVKYEIRPGFSADELGRPVTLWQLKVSDDEGNSYVGIGGGMEPTDGEKTTGVRQFIATRSAEPADVLLVAVDDAGVERGTCRIRLSHD